MTEIILLSLILLGVIALLYLSLRQRNGAPEPMPEENIPEPTPVNVTPDNDIPADSKFPPDFSYTGGYIVPMLRKLGCQPEKIEQYMWVFHYKGLTCLLRGLDNRATQRFIVPSILEINGHDHELPRIIEVSVKASCESWGPKIVYQIDTDDDTGKAEYNFQIIMDFIAMFPEKEEDRCIRELLESLVNMFLELRGNLLKTGHNPRWKFTDPAPGKEQMN